MSPRTSLVVAVALVAIGVWRLTTDTLHELEPEYWRAVDGSWLRYVIRAPSDGTVAGRLNAQWFKVLSIPSGIALIYLRSRLAADVEFHDRAVRGVWIGVFLVGFTVLELQKQLGTLDRVAGEDPRLNHLAHLLSAFLAWVISGVLTLPAVEDDGAR